MLWLVIALYRRFQPFSQYIVKQDTPGKGGFNTDTNWLKTLGMCSSLVALTIVAGIAARTRVKSGSFVVSDKQRYTSIHTGFNNITKQNIVEKRGVNIPQILIAPSAITNVYLHLDKVWNKWLMYMIIMPILTFWRLN